MKRILNILSVCLFLFVFASCNERDLDSLYWGQTKYFEPFLWKKCPPDTLTRTLCVSFNKDAKSDITKPLVLALYRVDGDDVKPVSPSEAEVFVDGVLSGDNRIHITPGGDKELKVGVVFTKDFLASNQGDRDIAWVFKVEENPGFDRINDTEVAGHKTPLLDKKTDPWTPMDIHINHVSNKLKVGTITTLAVVMAILIAMVLLVQLVIINRFKYARISKIWITDKDNRLNVQKYDRSAPRSKAIIITGGEKKQGLLNRLFTGRVTYVYVGDLPRDITLMPGKGRHATKVSGRVREIYNTAKSVDGKTQTISTLDGSFKVEFCIKD